MIERLTTMLGDSLEREEGKQTTMTSISVKRQRELLTELSQLVSDRAHDEVAFEEDYARRKQAALDCYAAGERAAIESCKEDTAALNSAYTVSLDEVMRDYDQLREQAAETHEIDVQKTREQAETKLKKARRDRRVTSLAADEHYEADIVVPQREQAEAEQFHSERMVEVQSLTAHVNDLLRRRRCKGLAGQQLDLESQPMETAIERYNEAILDARRHVQRISNQLTAKYFEEGWPILLFIIAWGLCVYPAGTWLTWGSGWQWIVASAGGGVIVTLLVTIAIYPFVRRQTARVYPDFQLAIQQAERGLIDALQSATARNTERQKTITNLRDSLKKAAETTLRDESTETTNRRDEALKAAAEDYVQTKQQLATDRDDRLQSLNDKYPRLIDQREQEKKSRIAELAAERDAELAANQQEYDERWGGLIQRWTTGTASFQAAIAEMNDYCDTRFTPWERFDVERWQPSEEVVDALRFGRSRFQLDMLDRGIPTDPRLAVEETQFELPGVLSFPDCPSLLLEAQDEGRDRAVATIQDVMLRLLTSLPPGKVRFTIIDPTGLGQNFSAFMHLADYDEQLVSNRIWTEGSHINQRLTDLTEHMEKVIQKYLRNEFESIQQYNLHAGEVAEPFQILVVANFPANFSDEAARRLVSIAGSGARCGVYTLVSVDTKLNLPRNFDLGDLRAQGLNLQWSAGEAEAGRSQPTEGDARPRFVWGYDDLRHLPLELEAPPDDELFSEAVKAAGREAKDSNRVEVPFASVAATSEQMWTLDSRDELEVPLGKAGATKLQYMRLGKGTSQHVLISGKTGSGKSTLLHAMITNLALYYSPDEVEFYLIDFKKGVEFRPYAALELPHARVIAIESEREFGMSVLERLDAELKHRGDLFRQEGVQSVAAYRNAHPDQRLPRVLLIIDEFQELFVKDDKLAQDASLLLDRLVRQGRAFGIHVLLGSQTLAGAYSLARSTIGQMAVRVALQCSETDAHLILSEDNTAARLLSRPGEAIYNDANGLLEGNHPFQVVWLPDEEREGHLQRLHQLTADRETKSDPPIVFEGNVAADLSQNSLLSETCLNPPAAAAAPRAWLGAAVAIKDPTCARFRRQSGANLLVVGQHPEMATGVLASCLLSLAAHQSTDSSRAARFLLLDGTRMDEPQYWARFGQRSGLAIDRGGPREMADLVSQVADEVERRTTAGDEGAAAVYLTIVNLARFRDLKKSDDDFGFSGFGDDGDKPAAAGKRLTTVLRDGPGVGVHTIIWCDTFNNATRWLDRQTLRDLEMRVLFQMSSTDSSNLMDSPEASRLGMHRAILYSEEIGEWEKFRPYGPPAVEWLEAFQRRMDSRTDHPVEDGAAG